MAGGNRARGGWTRLEEKQAEALVPLVEAGMTGLRRSRWRPGDPTEYLVAPIVLQVLVAVSRDLGLGEGGDAA